MDPYIRKFETPRQETPTFQLALSFYGLVATSLPPAAMNMADDDAFLQHAILASLQLSSFSSPKVPQRAPTVAAQTRSYDVRTAAFVSDTRHHVARGRSDTLLREGILPRDAFIETSQQRYKSSHNDSDSWTMSVPASEFRRVSPSVSSPKRTADSPSSASCNTQRSGREDNEKEHAIVSQRRLPLPRNGPDLWDSLSSAPKLDAPDPSSTYRYVPLNRNIVGGGGAVSQSITPPAAARRALSKGNIAPRVSSRGNIKPLPKESNQDEYQQSIESEIIQTTPNVQWEDVACLDNAKRVLKEAVVLPLLFPELFTGIRSPWRGILLYGPPGTGKTLLAKAVATECRTTFFSVSGATLVSKYHGESEKMVRALFKVARQKAPSTIFLDEVDALMGRRGDGSEHDASRRLKAELLQQLDGLPSCSDSTDRDGEHKMVMVLATTNRPWDLDEALRRRLEKRIYIPLPAVASRKQILTLHLKDVEVTNRVVTIDKIGLLTEGYSGADLKVVCRDASLEPLRRLMATASAADIQSAKNAGTLQLVVTDEDLTNAVKRCAPSVGSEQLGLFDEWALQFGSI